MPLLRQFCLSVIFFFTPVCVSYSACADCCNSMGGIHYCDSSASRFVCKNGFYSSCYCNRHAVMDLQKISGCCLWQGGVMASDEVGLVVCNNGGISEICSLQVLVPGVSVMGSRITHH